MDALFAANGIVKGESKVILDETVRNGKYRSSSSDCVLPLRC